MPQGWIVLALLCAGFVALSDVFLKKLMQDCPSRLALFFKMALALPVFWGLALLDMPKTLNADFFIPVLISAPIELLAIFLYARAIRISPLGLTLPFLSLTPIFMTLSGWLVLGEKVSLFALAGIGLIVLGGYTLHLTRMKHGWLAPIAAIFSEEGSVLMIGVAFIYAITSVLGKKAIGASSPMFFAAFYHTCLVVMMIPLAWKERGWITRERRWTLLQGCAWLALLYIGLIVTHMFGIRLTQAAYFISVKRLSLLLGVVMGAFFFQEEEMETRIPGALMMFGGFLIVALKG